MKWLKVIAAVLLSLAALAYLVNSGDDAYRQGRRWVERWLEKDEPQITTLVLAEGEAKRLAAKRLRQQIITFQEFEPLTWESQYLFMIGVGQSTLRKPETIKALLDDIRGAQRAESAENTRREAEFLSLRPGSGMGVNLSKPRSLSGNFNNILLYDAAKDDVIEVFADRVAVYRAQANWAKEPTHIVLFAATDDTDNDGKLSQRDEVEVFIYNISKRMLVRVETQNAKPESISDVFNADFVVVHYRVDRNKDGKFTSFATKDEPEEPVRYMKVDLNTGAISDLVPDEMRRRLQKRLQGEEP